LNTDNRTRPRISFSRESIGVPQTWDVEWRGLPHTGQVIVLEKLNSEDFLPLFGEISFRIIFTNRGLKPRDRAGDSRIALAVRRFRFDAVTETERVSSALHASHLQ